MTKRTKTIGLTAAATAVIVITLLLCVHWPHKKAEWTVLIYMNAADGLDSNALCTFAQLAAVDSGPNLNIVVELSRSATSYASTIIQCGNGITAPFKNWIGTRRYLVRGGADTDSFLPGQDYQNRDVRDAEELGAFSGWAVRRFPAKHYAFIFWGHGSASPGTNALLSVTKKKKKKKKQPPWQINKEHQEYDSAFWSIYRDPQSHLPKLRLDRASSIFQSTFGDTGIDLIGFDSCLKGMIETAYTLHRQAKIFVASEDAIPSDGWGYRKWLTILKDSPMMSALQLGQTIHRTYVDTHNTEETLTVAQSVIDLSKIPDLAQALDDFVRTTMADPAWMAKVSEARKDLNVYGGMNAIDLMNWLDFYEAQNPSPASHTAELRLKSSLQQAIASNYRNFLSRSSFGSNGLSIYFPKTISDYQKDRDCKAYDPSDSGSVPFARDHAWAIFLRRYWKVDGTPTCEFTTEPI